MMNKVLLAIVALSMTVITAANAQLITNPEFETWAPNNGYLEPVGWMTNNGLGGDTMVRQGAGYTGTYSAHLVSDTSGSSINGGQIGFIHFGSERPDVVMGWWKGTMAGAPFSELISVTVDVFDASGNDIGFGDASLDSTQSTWTQFVIPVTYNLSNTPAHFDISFQVFSTSLGSDAFVDHLSMTTTTGINEIHRSGFSLYPNPAHGAFTINTGQLIVDNGQLKIYDVSGREVYQQKINNHSQSSTVNCQLNAGVYFVKVLSGEGVFTQKLIVE